VDIKEIGREDVDWIHLVQNTDQWRVLVKTVKNLRIPKKVWNFMISWMTISFSRRTLFHKVS